MRSQVSADDNIFLREIAACMASVLYPCWFCIRENGQYLIFAFVLEPQSITKVTTDNGRDFLTMANLTFNEYQSSIIMVEQIKEMLLPVNSNKKLYDNANISFRQTQ